MMVMEFISPGLDFPLRLFSLNTGASASRAQLDVKNLGVIQPPPAGSRPQQEKADPLLLLTSY